MLHKKNTRKQTLGGKKAIEGVAGERMHASLLYIITLSTSLFLTTVPLGQRGGPFP